MRQLLCASQERQAAHTAVARDARARLLARLQVAWRHRERWEDSELSHGTERWQQQLVVLHEMDLARRDERQHGLAQQAHLSTLAPCVMHCVAHCIVHCIVHCVAYCIVHCIVYCAVHCIMYCTVHCIVHHVAHCGTASRDRSVRWRGYG